MLLNRVANECALLKYMIYSMYVNSSSNFKQLDITSLKQGTKDFLFAVNVGHVGTIPFGTDAFAILLVKQRVMVV